MAEGTATGCFKALDIITVYCLYVYTLMLNAVNNFNICQTNCSVRCEHRAAQ
jgi:hypothetical protein